MGLKINGKEMSPEDIKNYISGEQEEKHYTVFIGTKDVCEYNFVTLKRAKEIVEEHKNEETCIVDINTGEEIL